MNRRSSSLLFAAMSLVGLSSYASAQLTVTLPTVDFNDPVLSTPPGAVNPNNQVYSATVTSNFYFSPTVNQLGGGSVERFNVLTTTATSGFRVRNSAYPGIWADFTILNTAWGVEVTANVTATTRTASGPLVNSAITNGSTMSFEAFNNFSGGAAGFVEVRGTNIGFTINAAAFTSTVASTFTFSGNFPAVSTGSITSGSQFTATAGGSQFIIGSQTLVNSMVLDNYNSSNQAGEFRLTGQNSAYPGVFLSITPWNSSSGFPVGAGTFSWAGIGGNATGTMAGAIINPGTTWTWTVFDNSDQGTDGIADFGVSNISFSLTGTSFSSTYSSGLLAGPYNAGGTVGSPDNATITLPAVASDFIMGSTVVFSGTATRVNTLSQASELRVRVRNSAYPTFYTLEFQPTVFDFTGGVASVSAFQISSPSPRDVYTNRQASTLRGLNIPAGSTFSVEFWDSIDNGAGADAQWTNVDLRFQSGAAWGPTGTAPVTFTDLGSLSNANATTANALSATSPAIADGTPQWFRLVVPNEVNGGAGFYLNLYTSSAGAGSLSDSTISLFDNDGRHLAFDDDSALGLFSMLTFGAAGATTPYGVNFIAGEEAFNGKDGGGLPAGTYWIAVSPYSSTGSFADGFNVLSGSTGAFAGGVRLNAISNLPASPLTGSQILTGTLTLSDTGEFGGGLNRYITYSVIQDGSIVGGGMVTASGPSTPFALSLPVELSGPVTIVWDGSSFLQRTTTAELSNSNQEIGTIQLQNGDVDGSGEVDAADIDEVIGHFGETWPGGYGNINADLDVSGEVDSADIDIVIANFGGQDN